MLPSIRSLSVPTLCAYVHASTNWLTLSGRVCASCCATPPAMGVSHNGGSLKPRFHHDDVQVGCEREDIVGTAEFAAFPMAAKIGDQHAKVVVQKLDERIEHRAGDHEPVQRSKGSPSPTTLQKIPFDARHSRGLADMVDPWRIGARARYHEAAREMQVVERWTSRQVETAS